VWSRCWKTRTCGFFVTDDGIKDTLEAITKWSKEFNKKETHFIIGGGMEGELLSQEKVEGLEDLLTKKEAAQAIASSIKGIQAKPARAINSVLSKLARAVKLAAETKE
jgi:ribosomal protein L10